MAPGHEHVDQVLCDFSFGKEHFEDLMLEDGLQILKFEGGCNPEHASPIETPISNQDMTVGIKSQEIPKGLYGNNSPWHGIVFRYRFLEKEL